MYKNNNYYLKNGKEGEPTVHKIENPTTSNIGTTKTKYLTTAFQLLWIKKLIILEALEISTQRETRRWTPPQKNLIFNPSFIKNPSIPFQLNNPKEYDHATTP